MTTMTLEQFAQEVAQVARERFGVTVDPDPTPWEETFRFGFSPLDAFMDVSGMDE